MWKLFVSVAVSVSHSAPNRVRCKLCREGQLKEESFYRAVQVSGFRLPWCGITALIAKRHNCNPNPLKIREISYINIQLIELVKQICVTPFFPKQGLGVELPHYLARTPQRRLTKKFFLLHGKFIFISFRLPLNFALFWLMEWDNITQLNIFWILWIN